MNNTSEIFRKIADFYQTMINKLNEEKERVKQNLEEIELYDLCIITDKAKNTKKEINLYGPSKTKNPIKRFQEEKIKYECNLKKNEEKIKLQKKLQNIEIQLNKTKNYSKNITRNGIKGPIEEIAVLFCSVNYLGILIDISLSELKTVLGVAIRTNYDYYKYNQKAKKEVYNSENVYQINELEICLNLGLYFDKKGNVLPNKDEERFERNLYKLFAERKISCASSENLFKKDNLPTISDVIESLMNDLQNQNKIKALKSDENEQKKKINLEKLKLEEQRRKELNDAWRKEKEALKEMSAYYKGGIILKGYEDEEYFLDLLSRCNLNKEEINKILRLMNNYMKKNQEQEKEKQLSKYLLPEEIKIIKFAQKNYSLNYNIAYFLKEINDSLELIESSSTKEDIELLTEYLKENISNLKYSIGPTEKNKNTLLKMQKNNV